MIKVWLKLLQVELTQKKNVQLGIESWILVAVVICHHWFCQNIVGEYRLIVMILKLLNLNKVQFIYSILIVIYDTLIRSLLHNFNPLLL